MNESALVKAKQKRFYKRLYQGCPSKHLLYPGNIFTFVFNNGVLKHIPGKAFTLQGVNRILSSDEVFAFSVLTYRYFEWWPLGHGLQEGYQQWQRFHHTLDLVINVIKV